MDTTARRQLLQGDGGDQQQQQRRHGEGEDEANCCCPGQMPSTSSAVMAADDVGTAQQQGNDGTLDKSLEMFACSYNLTAQNVKNIIFHIVKNPQTFATLVRKDPDAMAGLRMTRARLRQLERIARRRIPSARLRPIAGPKTFLDINYGDDDDEEDNGGSSGGGADGSAKKEQHDADYCPANDPTTSARMSGRKRRGRNRRQRREAHSNLDHDSAPEIVKKRDDEEEMEEDDEDVSSSACSSDTDFVCTTDMDEEQQQQGEHDKDGTECHQKRVEGDGIDVGEQQQQRRHLVKEEDGKDEIGRQNVEFLTRVDNPIYPMFIRSLATGTDVDPEARQQLYDDEDNDPEYVFQDFDDFCDEQEDAYEFRRDRATEIPRWEVKALEQDFVDGDDDDVDHPSPLDVPVEPIFGGTTPAAAENGRQSRNNKNIDEMIGGGDKESTVKIFWSKNYAKPSENLCMPPNAQHSNNGANGMPTIGGSCGTASTAGATENEASKKDSQPTNSAAVSSCSLLNPSPIIGRIERDALKVQLEKHVQLLCQAIVGTSQYPELVDPHNKAMLMLHELDALSRDHGGDQSVFNVPTLESAIYCAHDIKACREVNLALTPADNDGDVHHRHYQRCNNEQQPSNETMWVLARSAAVRYPDLLCPYRFHDGSAAQAAKMMMPVAQPSRFLQSEQLLLAIGLYQLNGVPSRNCKTGIMRNRFELIQQHFLPAKRVDQIRNHIRNVHSCPSPTIYHRLIMEAEKGHFPVTYRPDLGEKAQQKLPIEWPSDVQPFWLKWLSNLLGKCQTQMIMVDHDGAANQKAADDGELQNSAGIDVAEHQRMMVSRSNTNVTKEDNNQMNDVGGSSTDWKCRPSDAPSPTTNTTMDDISPSKTVLNVDDGGRGNLSTTNRHASAGQLFKEYTAQQQQRSRDDQKQKWSLFNTPSKLTSRKRCLSATTASPLVPVDKSVPLISTSAEHQLPAGDDCGGGVDNDDEVVGMQTRWRKRIRTASTLEEDEHRHRRMAGTAATTSSNSANVGADASTTMAMMPTTTVEYNGIHHGNNDNNSTNNCSHISPQLQHQRKSRRHERAERGMAALSDARAHEQTERALASAIYEDFRKRMFMHQDKLRAVLRVLACHNASSSSVAQCFTSLWELMGLTHPQLFHLFAAIAPEAQLPHALRVDHQWQSCKRALHMLQTIHTYLAASRTPAQMKHMLKFLKEASMDITSERHFFETLQRQFAVREEPLWHLLRREWMGAKFVDAVEDWEYELVDMDKQQQCTSETATIIGQNNASNLTAWDNSGGIVADGHHPFEHVRVPYRRDPSERSRLRVRHGRVTAELNGRLCNVTIAYAPSAPPAADHHPSTSSATTKSPPPSLAGDEVVQQQQQSPQTYRGNQQPPASRCWTRKMDMELMFAYNRAAGDVKNCVCAFLQYFAQVKLGEAIEADEVEKRLVHLLGVANKLMRRTSELDKK